MILDRSLRGYAVTIYLSFCCGDEASFFILGVWRRGTYLACLKTYLTAFDVRKYRIGEDAHSLLAVDVIKAVKKFARMLFVLDVVRTAQYLH